MGWGEIMERYIFLNISKKKGMKVIKMVCSFMSLKWICDPLVLIISTQYTYEVHKQVQVILS
jgi:hypothetical protein